MLRSPAELLYEKLSGIACLFKPVDMQMQHFFPIVQERLASGSSFEGNERIKEMIFSSFKSNVWSITDASC